MKEKVNQGIATVEACIIVPLFLFFMLAMTHIYFMYLAEAHIHQSLSEAAIYTAKYCYLEQKLRSKTKIELNEEENSSDINMIDTGTQILNAAVLRQQFIKCLGEDETVDKVVDGGKNGIVVFTETIEDSGNCFFAKANYNVQIVVPIFGEFTVSLCNQVKQKAFIGYQPTERTEPYVYVTPNQQVYHLTRGCTHLSLDVIARSSKEYSSYQACYYCGKSEHNSGLIYVTRTSNLYHFNRECSGLKRTIYRIRKSEVGGLSACQRCGN